MPRISRIGFVAIVTMLLTTVAADAGGIPAKTVKDLKAATVYIKVQFRDHIGPLPATGSGFLLRVDKMGDSETGYIVTNNHVVNAVRAGLIREGNPTLVFHSGTPKEKTVEAVIVASDPIHDLAILKVTGFKGLPRPIPINPEIEATETMTVYSLGFPFGKTLVLDKGNHPAINITRGSVTSLRNDRKGEVVLVQIDAEINPGNSGGPIVDDKGNLIGVAVSKLIQARTVGFAIPVKPVVDMMNGKLARLVFDPIAVQKGKAQISVDAGLIDPLHKVKDLVVYYRTFTDAKEIAQALPKEEKDGKVQQLQKAKKVGLKIESDKGLGTFFVERGPSPKLNLLVQASYVNGAGQKITTPAYITALLCPDAIFTDKLTRLDPIDKTHGQPCKRFTYKMQAGKHYVIEMRGDPKLIDPWLILRDSTGKILAQDDDSGGFPNALIVFAPVKDDDYEITTTVFKGAALGPFRLRIREETGQALTADKKGISKLGTLSATDPVDPLTNAPAQTFNFVLKQGKPCVIDMKSKEFDPYLRIENMAGLNLKVEDIGGDGHSTLVYTPPADGVYRVVATSYDARTGAFDLKVAEAPPPKQYDVGPDGLKLAAGLTITDPVDFEMGKATQYRCKIYLMKMKAGQKYQLDLTSAQFDPVLRIEDPRGKEVAFDRDSSGKQKPSITFVPQADGAFRVIVSHSDTRLGNFDLNVRTVAPPKENKN